jgi:sulfonate transport system ATP-binding protein
VERGIQGGSRPLRIADPENSTILVTHSVEVVVFPADRLVILNAKPGRIHNIISVDLKRPRNRASEEFVRLRTQVLNILSGPCRGFKGGSLIG